MVTKISLEYYVVELVFYTFSISCSSGLLANKFFTYVLSEHVFILPSFLNIFAEYRILGWLFLHHFKDVDLFSLVSLVSDVSHI